MSYVELSTTNEDDEQSIELTKYLKKEIGDKSSVWTLGDFLTKIGQYQQAENYYRLLEHALPESEIDRATIFNRIAYIRYEKKDFHVALEYLEKAMQYLPKNSANAAITVLNQQTIAAETSVSVLCAPILRRRLEKDDISIKFLVSDSATTPIVLNNFGHVHHQQGNYETALAYYQDALNILLEKKQSFIPEISAVYNNIGGVKYTQLRYSDAAKSFRQAMIELAQLDNSHPWIQDYIENYKAAQRREQDDKSKRFRAE